MKFGDSDNKKGKKGKGGRSPSFGGGPSLATVLELQAQIAATNQQANSFATQAEVDAAVAAREAAQAAADAAQDSAAQAANAAQDAAAVAEEMNDATEEAATDAEQAAQDSSINDNATDIATLSGNITALGASITAGQAAQDNRLAAIEAQLPDDDSAIMARLDALEALPADDDSDLQAQVDELRALLLGNTWSITPATDGDLTRVFDWNTGTQNDILCNRYKVTIDPDSIDPLTELVIPFGETVTAHIIGVLAMGNGASNNNVGGVKVELTNTDGVLSGVLVEQHFLAGTDWENLSYNQLTGTNANVGALTDGNLAHIFTAIPGLIQDDDSELEARIAAIEAIGAMTYDDTQVQADIDALEAAVAAIPTDDDSANSAAIAALQATVDALPVDDDSVNTQAIADLQGLVGGTELAAAPVGDPVFDISSLTEGDSTILATFRLSPTSGFTRDIAADQFYVAQGTNTTIADAITELTLVDGATDTLFIIGQGDGTVGIVGLQLDVTNTAGVLSHTIEGIRFRNITGSTFDQVGYADLGADNANALKESFELSDYINPRPSASGETVIERLDNIEAQLPDDDSGLLQATADNAAALAVLQASAHDGAAQDARLDALEASDIVTDDEQTVQDDRLAALEAWIAAGLPGQIAQVPDPDADPEWVYPYGFGRVRQVTPFTTTDVDDMDDADALVDSIDTTGFVAGTYLITAVAKANYSQASSDYLFGLYDEAEPDKNAGGGVTNALDFGRFEPKDVGGNQRYPIYLETEVVVPEGGGAVYSYRAIADTAGQDAETHNLQLTILRVGD